MLVNMFLPREKAKKDKKATGETATVLKTFVESSSVKGLPKVFKSKTTFQRLLWIFCLLIGLGIGLYQLVYLFVQYLTYETSTSTSEQYKHPTMPDISICNLNPLSTNMSVNYTYSDYFLQVYDDAVPLVFSYPYNIVQSSYTLQQYQLLDMLSSEGYFQNLEAYEDANLESTVNNFIVDCLWKPWNTVAANDLPGCHRHAKYFYSHHYGPCFTMTLPSRDKATDAAQFVVLLYIQDVAEEHLFDFSIEKDWSYASGVTVQIHPRGTLPDMSHGITVSPGQETTLHVEQTSRSRLGEPYGVCREGHSLPMATSYKYNQDTCHSLCTQLQVIRSCGCITNKLLITPEMREHNIFCAHVNYTDFSITSERLLCADSTINRADVHNCNCDPACMETLYQPYAYQAPWPHESHHSTFYDKYIYDRISDWWRFSIYDSIFYTGNYSDLYNVDLIKRNFMQLNVKMKYGVKEMTDSVKISGVSLMGTLGGILNLWIGFTFVTVVEICDLIYQLIVTAINKRKKRNENIVQPITNGLKL